MSGENQNGKENKTAQSEAVKEIEKGTDYAVGAEASVSEASPSENPVAGNNPSEPADSGSDGGCPLYPSIFDKPEHNYKKARRHLPKWLVALLSSVICAALVLSAVFIPKLISNGDNADSPDSSDSEISITLCDYSAYNDTMDEVESLGKGGIKNIIYSVEGFDFELVQGEYEETVTDDDGNEKTETKVGWTIGNYTGIAWSSSNISGLVQNALTVTAITKLEDNAENLSIYGLDDESRYSSLSVNFKDGSGYTVEVGDYSSDRSGRYIRFSGEKTVYLSSYSLANYTSLSPKNLPALSNLGMYESTGNDSAYYSDGKLMYFDGIFMFGRSLDQTITFTPTDSESTYTYYKMMTPVETATDDDAVYEVFSVLAAGFSANSVLEFMPSAETVASYGIDVTGDDNYLKVMYIVGGVTYQIAIGNKLPDGGYPVMINSGNVIYEVSADTFTFINSKYTDYMRTTLFLADIRDMKSVKVKGEGIDAEFDITNTLTDEENNVYEQTVSVNGKNVDTDSFKHFLSAFQKLQATAYDDVYFGETSEAPTLTVTVKYSDETVDDTVITLYKYSSRRYLYKTDGSGNSLISIADYNGVVEKAKIAVTAEQ